MQEAPASKESRLSRFLKLLLKIAVTIACLWYISTRISFNDIKVVLQKADWAWLALSLGIFTLAKMVASFRLNINFRNIRLQISEADNLRLFWLGMFYNLFLPGSITGDAYKVILLSKRFKAPYKKTTAAVLLDRFSGLLGLGILAAIYSFFALANTTWSIVLLAGAVAGIFVFYLVIQRLFRDFLPGFKATFVLGLVVQCLMVACAYSILLALRIGDKQAEYIFIFLVATVASVLPLTIGGGLGIREFVFYKGALMLGIDEHTAIIVSLLFYQVTLITSLTGAVYVFRNVFANSRANNE
jgi:glycosyltransferase 2 family protein